MQIIMNRLYPPGSSSTNLLAMTTESGDGGAVATRGAAASGDDFGTESDLKFAGAGESYSVFCVVRVNDEIKDTRLVFDIQPNTADVEFDESLVFDNVRPDFRLVVEVYASAPRSHNWRRTWYPDYTKKTMESMDFSGGHPNGVGPSQFELIGSCVSTIADVKQNILTRSLELRVKRAADSCDGNYPATQTSGLEPWAPAAVAGLPVFGSICYKLIVQPQSVLTPVFTGHLWIRKLSASPVQEPAHLYHCVLVNRCLEASWLKSREKQSVSTPLKSILSQTTSETGGHSTEVSLRAESNQPRRTCSEEESLPRSAFTLPITPMTKFLDISPQLRSVDVAVSLPVAINRSRPQSDCVQLIDRLGNRQAVVPPPRILVNRVLESLPINGEAAPDTVVLPQCQARNTVRSSSLEAFTTERPLCCASNEFGRSTCGVEALLEVNGVDSLASHSRQKADDVVEALAYLSAASDGAPAKQQAQDGKPFGKLQQQTDGVHACHPFPEEGQIPAAAAAVVFQVNMPTFRIATQSTGESHFPPASSVQEVFEIASSGHPLDLTIDSSSPQLDQLSDPVSTASWLAAMRQHIEEQKTWGDAAFANQGALPSIPSTVCNSSAKRSSNIPLHSQLSLSEDWKSQTLPKW